MLSFMEEIWRKIPRPHYELFHEVSNRGRMRRVAGVDADGLHRVERYHKPWLHPTGYYRAALSANKKKWFPFIHYLVAITFLGEPPGLAGRRRENWHVHHIDGNPLNNSANNLQWLVCKEHMKTRKFKRGEKHHNSKLSDAQMEEIKKKATSGIGVLKLAREYGMAKSSLQRRLKRGRYAANQ